MSLIVVENVTKNFADKDVLKGICATLAPSERVAMVGANGCGKTTLLRIMAGMETPTDGRCSRRNGLRVGYLPQEPPAPSDQTLKAAMLEVFDDLAHMEMTLHELSDRMHREGENASLLQKFGQIQHEFEARGGYDVTRRVENVLEGLHFGRDLWDRPLSQLSGGQRTRAWLGRLLLEQPEVLLLDEPTNHLDLDSVEWLEGWLADFGGSLVVVSHDRYFLDRTTNCTWELSFAHLESYRGGYSEYVVKRQERYEQRLKQWQAQKEYIDKTQEYIRRYGANQRAAQARGRKTRLQRFIDNDAVDRPNQEARISVRLQTADRAGDLAMELVDLAAGYAPGEPLVVTGRLRVMRGERIAIVGPNGCGKTTLLRTILGQLPPLAGSVRLGANVRFGVLTQTHSELDPGQTALESVRSAVPGTTEQQARDALGAMLLSGDEALRTIRELSGGQRSRVVLARLMLLKANVLVLDEPTNHLDIPSQETLQAVLNEFEGTVVFVSHDRYLIDALAADVWTLSDRAVHRLSGGWQRYLAWRDVKRAEQAAANAGGEDAQERAIRKEDHQHRRRQANRLQRIRRRFEDVEREIANLEEQLKRINHDINQAGLAGQVGQIEDLGRQYTQTDARLNELMTEWETLGVELHAADNQTSDA